MVESLIHLLIWLIVVGLILWIIHWILTQIPLPEPFATVARVGVLVVGAIIVILILLQFAGIVGGGKLPRLGELAALVKVA